MCHKPFFGHLSICEKIYYFTFVLVCACALAQLLYYIDGMIAMASAIRITGIELYWLYWPWTISIQFPMTFFRVGFSWHSVPTLPFGRFST